MSSTDDREGLQCATCPTVMQVDIHSSIASSAGAAASQGYLWMIICVLAHGEKFLAHKTVHTGKGPSLLLVIAKM